MIRETEAGAYLGPGSGLIEATQAVASDPHFDVFDREGVRLVLVKCSRLPDDEDEAGGRYGIDFHRALPPFQGDSGFFCDWGEGAMPVNAYTYATHLPRALRFREFTAKIAFAAGTLTEYEA